HWPVALRSGRGRGGDREREPGEDDDSVHDSLGWAETLNLRDEWLCVDPAVPGCDRIVMRHEWVAAATVLVLAAPVASAQRYRVLVGEAGSPRVSLIEFRPCVPAETSDCGAWLVQAFDATVDSAMRPGQGARQVVSRRAGSIAIDGESVVVTPM